ncbi:MAG: SCO1664 family protein [Actinomycetota bacterium]|nr:SCO1664 family protein [Actinomycetota bacterium]
MPANELAGGVPADALDVLTTADIVVEGRMPWASNGTFLVRLVARGADCDSGDDGPRGIYKPVRGERPLWDFEPGLHRRELAAYLLSEAMGIGAVPPTVVRPDAPLGEGSVQWFVDADHREHYFTIAEQRLDLHDQLRAIAVLDVVANNTDRKSGHCLLAGDRVWAIDNGLCFAADYKLRTVIWEFAGDALTDAQVAAVTAVAECVPTEIAALLAPPEVDGMRRRAAWLAEHRVLPGDDSGHRYPWPLV